MLWPGDIEARTAFAADWVERQTLAKFGKRLCVGGPTRHCFAFVSTWGAGCGVPQGSCIGDQLLGAEPIYNEAGLTQTVLFPKFPWRERTSEKIGLVLDEALNTPGVKMLRVSGKVPSPEGETPHVIGLVDLGKSILWLDSLAQGGKRPINKATLIRELQVSFTSPPRSLFLEAIAERQIADKIEGATFFNRSIMETPLFTIRRWMEAEDDFL